MQSRKRGSRRQGQRGETLIEFAFASVIFFMLIFGIIQFGIVIWNYNLVSNLAQEGARYAAVHGAGSGATQNESQVATWVQSRAIGMAVTTTMSPSTAAPGNVIAGNPVAVTVTHTLNWGGGLLPVWSFNVQSTARMIVTR
jgi:Flp pilus assembly protein TadG